MTRSPFTSSLYGNSGAAHDQSSRFWDRRKGLLAKAVRTHQSKEMAGELERVRKALRELSKSLKSLPGDPAPKEVHKLRTATRRVEAIAAALPHGRRKEIAAPAQIA